MGRMKPIGRRNMSLADVAYQRISENLLSGRLQPGARLVMDQLADELDISRTPVRDALARLELEGMVEPTGRRGFVVHIPTPRETLHIYEAREAVEGFASRRVAELGPKAIAEVRTAIRSTADVDMADAQDVYEANMKIHRAVVAAAGNAALLEMFDMTWQRARALAAFAHYLTRRDTEETIECAHLPLVDAFEEGSDAAFAAMRDHIRKGRDTNLA